MSDHLGVHTGVAEIEGYAAIFHERDLNGDIIAPRAFARSLGAARPVRMLYQHAPEAPIGRWLDFAEDARGLRVRGEVLLSSPRAREVAALVAGGALDGLSIGYRTVRAEKGPGGARRIVEADLWEVSIVTFPMAPAARITRITRIAGAAGALPPPPQDDIDRFFPSDGRRVSPRGRLAGRAPRLPHAASRGARHFSQTLRAAAQSLTP